MVVNKRLIAIANKSESKILFSITETKMLNDILIIGKEKSNYKCCPKYLISLERLEKLIKSYTSVTSCLRY